MTSLIATDLDVAYGRLQAVRSLTFSVEEGQIVTLLGANGAGKTSVIRAICGLIPIAGGSLSLGTHRLNGLRPEARVALGIATVQEGRELFRSLTVDEN